jgi:hypothetical protein
MLNPKEKIECIRQIYSLFKLLHDEESLAGIVLTSGTYEQFKRELGDASIPYSIGDATLDPGMEHSFVVNGLLVMRGTQLR